MIELRWRERAHPPEYDGAPGYVERVLQYRHPVAYFGSDGKRALLYVKDKSEMTEWQDVPVAQETLAAEEG